MNLNEAVLLEIYRQALNASELANQRCQSRESTESEERCPSNDSHSSDNRSTAAPTPKSPLGIPLPTTLNSAAAAALLSPQSAAIAAYLNAAAAEQHRLLLAGNLPLAQNLPLQSTLGEDALALDFSSKRANADSDTDTKSDTDVVNLSGKIGEEKPSESGEFPLDLSCTSRKRTAEEDVQPQRKSSRSSEYKTVAPTWPTINPYLAAVAAASLSQSQGSIRNSQSDKGSIMETNDATKALEKMSEMTRLGRSDNDCNVRPTNSQSSHRGETAAVGNSGRHSAWQSHWLNKGADAAKDVFKCVWCKQSFPSLATLTTHMKETQHCGVNVPPPSNLLPSATGRQTTHHHNQTSPSSAANTSSSKSDLSLLIKETMPLPRKLVRGQDVWLGKGAEQTRQILKCMWCGQSFRSLAEMTSHMQQTQHYTNIISQEQIISWKSSDDKPTSSGGPPSGAGNGGPPNATPGPNANSTVSAVLTCKVCDQAFSSLKDLSNHMVKNAHYKEHIMRSLTETGGRRRQTREKRKKSLPVRKLLEFERAQQDYKGGEMKQIRPGSTELTGSTKITCEKCGDKIETVLFVEHIRQCVGDSLANSSSAKITRSQLAPNSIIPLDSVMSSPSTPTMSRDGRKSIGGNESLHSISPASSRNTGPDLVSPPLLKEKPGGNDDKGGPSSSSSLNALEMLIEKSFDTRPRHSSAVCPPSSKGRITSPLGSSILKRLGIDESVDYTKPLMDLQTMSLLRSYQQYPRGDNSGRDSSSASERGSSRLDSLTPERKPDNLNYTTSRRSSTEDRHIPEDDHPNGDIKVKREPTDDDDDGDHFNADKVSVKTEPADASKDSDCDLNSSTESKNDNQATSAASPNGRNHSSPPAASPCSDRCITPRSSTNSMGGDSEIPASSSLNGLLSMFENLNEGGGSSTKTPISASAAASTEASGRSSSTAEKNGGGGGSSTNPLQQLYRNYAKLDSGGVCHPAQHHDLPKNCNSRTSASPRSYEEEVHTSLLQPSLSSSEQCGPKNYRS